MFRIALGLALTLMGAYLKRIAVEQNPEIYCAFTEAFHISD